MNTIFALILLFPSLIFPIFDAYKAERAYKIGDYAQSSALLAEQLAAKPTPQAAYNLGVSQYRETKDKTKLQSAVEQFDAASQDAKLRDAAQFNKANALAHQGEYEKALAVLDEVAATAPSPSVDHNREIIKKLLEQKKKQEEEQKNKQDKDKDNKKDKQDKDKDQKDKQDQDNKDRQDQDQEKKEQQDKQNKEDKKSKKDKKKEEQEKREQERKEKEQEEQRKQQEKEKKDKEGDEQDQKQEQQPEQPGDQKQPAPEDSLKPELQSLLAKVQADDKKQAKKMMKAQFPQQQSTPGQKNW